MENSCDIKTFNEDMITQKNMLENRVRILVNKMLNKPYYLGDQPFVSLGDFSNSEKDYLLKDIHPSEIINLVANYLNERIEGQMNIFVPTIVHDENGEYEEAIDTYSENQVVWSEFASFGGDSCVENSFLSAT